MNITNDIHYIGVNDHNIDLFEGQFIVPEGMSYNSYVILDEKIAVMDAVERRFTYEWIYNLEKALDGKRPDYLIVQHMEPDHSAGIVSFMNTYHDAVIVASEKAFEMMSNFFGNNWEDRRIIVGENDTLNLGHHTLTFTLAPMVHWPEVIVTYDSTDKVLFSADAFGKFGANDTSENSLFSNTIHDLEKEWACEARRYYFGIVGKYGMQVQNLLKKLLGYDFDIICPLHGPVLCDNLEYYLNLYDIWSSYRVESEGVVIAYTSAYGNTKRAVEILRDRLTTGGCPKVVLDDLARMDMAEAVEDAFQYGKIILATTTYNGDIFPFMRDYISRLTERGFRNRTVGFIENGSWAVRAAGIMKNLFKDCKGISYTDATVRIKSALTEENMAQIDVLAEELLRVKPDGSGGEEGKYDMKALFKIGYGLYVVTSNDGTKDNGLIVNTVSQVTSSPNRVAVCINKQNYSHEVIKMTGIMNVNCLSVDAPFSIFSSFGFRSGRDEDKFKDLDVSPKRTDSGLVIFPKYINGYMSLKVEKYVDLDTHGMFICTVTEAGVISDRETMTYNYYQANVKPRPGAEADRDSAGADDTAQAGESSTKKQYVCSVCGYVYEGDELPEDFVCPICKHGAEVFEAV